MTTLPAPSARLVLAAASLGLAVLLNNPAGAQSQVQMFEETPSLEQLRSILIPESKGGASRKIELLGGRVELPRPVQPASMPVLAPTPAPVVRPAAVPQVEAAPVQVIPQAQPAAPAPTRVAATPPQPVAAPAPVQAETDVAGIVGFRINFALNSAVIPSEHYRFVDRIGELMRQEPALMLAVEGHTDALGSDAYNFELSHRRALAVASYLVNRYGVDPVRLAVVGKGESEPLMDNGYDPRNRRVQFVRVE